MRVADLAAAVFPAGALIAMDLLRAVVLRAIQRHQQLIVQNPIGRQMALGPQPRFDPIEQGEDRLGRDVIKQSSDVIVRGDLGHGEQRVGIALTERLLHPGLMGQKRRALRPEHRKRRQHHVGHGIAGVAPGALVRKFTGQRPQLVNQRVKTQATRIACVGLCRQ
jgi:hypothetical protein